MKICGIPVETVIINIGCELAGIENVVQTTDNQRQSHAETHSKRQATQPGCLPSLLGNGDKGIEIVYAVYRHEPTKEENLSFVLFESPVHLSFNSQQGPPLSSLFDSKSGLLSVNNVKVPDQNLHM